MSNFLHCATQSQLPQNGQPTVVRIFPNVWSVDKMAYFFNFLKYTAQIEGNVLKE